jgi:hypothetical protein
MTVQQDVSVFIHENCALAAIANGLRTQNLRDHLVGLRMHVVDDNFQGGLLHGAQERINPV